MVKRNAIPACLPGVTDAACEGEIKSLFDVSSRAGSKLGHLLQQKLPAFQTRADNIPGVSSGMGQVQSVQLKPACEPTTRDLE